MLNQMQFPGMEYEPPPSPEPRKGFIDDDQAARHLAEDRVVVRTPTETVPKVVEAGGFKNIHRPGVESRGIQDPGRRRHAEERFGLDRPVYGYLQDTWGGSGLGEVNDELDVGGAYGGAAWVMAPEAEKRTTVTDFDSLDLARENEEEGASHRTWPLAPLRKEAEKGFVPAEGDWSHSGGFGYTEAQILSHPRADRSMVDLPLEGNVEKVRFVSSLGSARRSPPPSDTDKAKRSLRSGGVPYEDRRWVRYSSVPLPIAVHAPVSTVFDVGTYESYHPERGRQGPPSWMK